jgi:nicotinamide-nucleotide amidase
MTNIEIITIGDEILIGQIVDTNSAWMGTELNNNGYNVKQITSVSDSKQHIINALSEASNRADVILITGGLGPTKDDITKYTLCEYFDSKLIFDEVAFKNIERLFVARNRTVSDTNRKQAELPDKCTPVYNNNGTAPGMWFEKNGKVYVSMPGVPYEMKAMMTDSVIPKLREIFPPTQIIHHTVLTQGIGESYLSDLISAWEDALPLHMKLAYLPQTGMVRLRLSARGNFPDLQRQVNTQLENLKPLIKDFIFGEDDDKIEEVVGRLLKEKKLTLAIAESCTGGFISHLITSVPGCSNYFTGSVISYDNKIKLNELSINESLLKEHGAVSEPVAKEMAIAIRKKFGTDVSISTTGIAGPTGGTALKPVGLVFIGVSVGDRTEVKKFNLGENRSRIIQATATTALNMLRKILIK